jgi:DNA recombination protein RmuC
MDPILIFGLAALLAAAALAVVLAMRGRGPDPQLTALAQTQSELAGRFAQMAEQMTATQAAIEAGLKTQEGAILGRLNESLAKSAVETTKTITDLRERLVKIDEAQKNLAELSTRVVGLQDILANKQARGAFGEVQLENLVQDALPPSSYEFQATLSNKMRVDCLIRMPSPHGTICVDAKFPLESYRALMAAPEPARAAALRAFGNDVNKHVTDIANKYILPNETGEGAMMFLPSEAVYAELHASLGDVVEKANRARVYIVSPTTLWAVLHTIRAVLKDVKMREQAGEIQRMVGLMIKDVRLLDDRAEKLQSHFEMAAKDVREIRTSTDRIIQRGDKIGEVEIEATSTPALAPVKV